MRISVTIFVILISTCIVNASVLDPVIENVVHLKASKPPSGVAGIWKKKTIWKPRWIKEWKSAKVMKPVWKKVWSPVQIREWVPIPKPPPGWDSVPSTPLTGAHPKPQKAPIKDSAGHDSFAVHSPTVLPLWDPVPYPESQQPPPPPPPFSQPLHNAGSSCGGNECDNSHSGTFNQEQISEIIGPKYNPGEHFQNPEYSETVNHLARLPPEGTNWRPPLPDFRPETRFNGFPGLPEFLVPPTVPDFRVQSSQNRQQHHLQGIHVQTGQNGDSGGFQGADGIRQWIPFPPEMNNKGHFITKAPDHPYKFHFPGVEVPAKNRTATGQKEAFSSSDNELKEKPNFQTHNISDSFRPQADGDFIQEAHLVGEYHYSEFDLANVKQESKIPEERVKTQQKPKPTGPNVQKTKTNHQEGNKPKQNRTETKHEAQQQQNGQHVQKKHISDFSSNSSNSNFFQQEKAFLKEILPKFNISTGRNVTSVPQNDRFALPPNDNRRKQQPVFLPTFSAATAPESSPGSSSTNVSIQQQTEKYPVYEIPTRHRFSPPFVSDRYVATANETVQQEEGNYPLVDFPQIPSNHRFSSPAGRLHQYATKLLPVAPEKATKSEKPLFGGNAKVQLVFPTTPVAVSGDRHDHEDPRKTTTTEPYSVIFSSSLLATTEAVTRSPLVIVTPVGQNQT